MAELKNEDVEGDTFLKHVAISLRDTQDLEVVKTRVKANRKRAKLAGVDLKDMDQTVKMTTWAPSEVAKWFSRKFSYLRHMKVDLAAQFDLFGGVEPVVKKAKVDYFHIGLLAGLEGKVGTPPGNLSGADAQQWQEGWNKGQEVRGMALEENAMTAASGGQASGAAAEDPEGQTDIEDPPGEVEGGAAFDGEASDTGEYLSLGVANFDCELLDECSADNYLGTPEGWDKAERIVVKDGDRQRVLKGGDARADNVVALEKPKRGGRRPSEARAKADA